MIELCELPVSRYRAIMLIVLSKEQDAIVSSVLSGHSIFSADQPDMGNL